jgi:hypothetical protein
MTRGRWLARNTRGVAAVPVLPVNGEPSGGTLLVQDQAALPAGKGVNPVSESSSPDASPESSAGPADDLNRDVQLADGTRLTETIKGRLTDQARRTASAAKARRVKNSDSEPGVLDLTPLRELLAELMEELEKLRLRDRVAHALRQAADVIDTQTPKP